MEIILNKKALAKLIKSIVKIRPFRYGNNVGINGGVGGCGTVKIRPFRYGNMAFICLLNLSISLLVKIRPFRYGNFFISSMFTSLLIVTLKSDRFGMEMITI